MFRFLVAPSYGNVYLPRFAFVQAVLGASDEFRRVDYFDRCETEGGEGARDAASKRYFTAYSPSPVKGGVSLIFHPTDIAVGTEQPTL